MRIAFIGEYLGPHDEGMKNVMRSLANELSRDNDVTQITLRNEKYRFFQDKRIAFLSPNIARQIKEFRPSVIHYIPYSGITLASFIRAKVLTFYAQKAKMIMSCLQYWKTDSSLLRTALPILKPDLVLVQSKKSLEKLSAMGVRTAFLPNGVDLDKFSPRKQDVKKKLRRKYGIADKFVILHVGHLKECRNIRVLGSLAGKDNLVLVVASGSTRADSRLVEFLRRKGVVIWSNYLHNIQDIYNLSDCYLFPTQEACASIEIPLSILEAMSCDLPIITSKFGGLPDIFEEGNGFYYFDDIDEINENIQKIRCGEEIANRQKVLNLSWKKVAQKLSLIYEQVCEGNVEPLDEGSHTFNGNRRFARSQPNIGCVTLNR